MVTLKGLTWDHPRGFDPLVACSRRYAEENGGARVEWSKRSLHDFGAFPIDVLAQSFDLLVIDHPFMGQALRTNCFHDLRDWIEPHTLIPLANQGAGPSGPAYIYQERCFALPTDAAAQVASYRPDLLAALTPTVPQTWHDVEQLAERAHANGQSLAWAGCPTDAACSFLTLAANLGHPLTDEDGAFLSHAVIDEVMRLLDWVVEQSQADCLDANPIRVYESMVNSDQMVYCPFAFGYSNYSREGQHPWLRFAPLAGPGAQPAHGALLGGAGMAMSRHCAAPEEAAAFMAWLHSAGVQAGTYAMHGGQPGNVAAWRSPAVNAESRDFFSDTLPTLEAAYVRPRFAGIVPFIEDAGVAINHCLRGQLSFASLVETLIDGYRQAWQLRDASLPLNHFPSTT